VNPCLDADADADADTDPEADRRGRGQARNWESRASIASWGM
jgi:hypothetical protein